MGIRDREQRTENMFLESDQSQKKQHQRTKSDKHFFSLLFKEKELRMLFYAFGFLILRHGRKKKPLF